MVTHRLAFLFSLARLRRRKMKDIFCHHKFSSLLSDVRTQKLNFCSTKRPERNFSIRLCCFRLDYSTIRVLFVSPNKQAKNSQAIECVVTGAWDERNSFHPHSASSPLTPQSIDISTNLLDPFDHARLDFRIRRNLRWFSFPNNWLTSTAVREVLAVCCQQLFAFKFECGGKTFFVCAMLHPEGVKDERWSTAAIIKIFFVHFFRSSRRCLSF